MASRLETAIPPRHLDFNAGWRFALGEQTEAARVRSFDDAHWRELHLPHDWSVEAPFSKEKGEGATGYLPGGVGWYRKHFSYPKSSTGRRLYVVFDGVYNHAECWLNGHPLGIQHYGYAPFVHDLTDYLAADGKNVLAVRVDRTRYCDSRWYPGSGIYRDVKLFDVGPVHVPVWGTYLTTPQVTARVAMVELGIELRNTTNEAAQILLATVVTGPSGQEVASAESTLTLAATSLRTQKQSLSVDHPVLWSPESPGLYTAETVVSVAGREVDRVCTRFGIRDFRFDKDHGFFLNGQATPIKGVCLHHDAGAVGAAVPRAVWERRLRKLKATGCSAIRTAHNPPSEEFLDLCDEMGFLVQHEFYDEWDEPKDKRRNFGLQKGDEITRGYAEHFSMCAEDDLKRTMRRDRNHPCVFMWSIGNEIEWCYKRYEAAAGYWDQGTIEEKAVDYYFSSAPPFPPAEIKARFNAAPKGKHELAETAHRLAAWTREMDTTRPVTANLVIPSVSHQTGYTDALDLVGYSYRAAIYDYGREFYPDQPIIGHENWTQWHEWKAVLDREFIAGIFLWTGIDYLGESAGKWPVRSSSSGLLDTAGFEKPSYHMFRSLWNDEPHVQMFTQALDQSLYMQDNEGHLVEREPGGWKHRKWGWHALNPHWNYEPGQVIAVEAYTNCAEVELLLNGDSQGVRRVGNCEDRVCKWAVMYEPGKLEVRGLDGGASAQHTIATASDPVAIELTVDRTEISARYGEAAHVIAQLVDTDGHPVRSEEREITFEPEGPIRLLGVDHGGADNIQPFTSNSLVTRHGRALLILGATDAAGDVAVIAGSLGLLSGSVTLKCVGLSRELVSDLS